MRDISEQAADAARASAFDAPPLDVDTIRGMVRRATSDTVEPADAATVLDLAGRLRDHIAALVTRPLGPCDEDLRGLLREAEFLLRSTASPKAPLEWGDVQALGYSAKGLLRRYEGAQGMLTK